MYFVFQLTLQKGGISDLSWSPNSAHIATASDDRTVMVWDILTQSTLCTLTGHANDVFCVAYNPLGNVIASGSFDESIKFWDVRVGSQCIATLPAHSDPVCSIGKDV
jgi:COMPASS component SWD3